MPIIALLIAFLLPMSGGAAPPFEVPQELIAVSRGSSQLLDLPRDLVRIAVADSGIANVAALSPREVLINGRTVGTTTLFVWDTGGAVRAYTVEVSIDVGALNRQYAALFPGEALLATAAGNVVVLSGTVSGAAVARRMVELARATGGTVIEHFTCVRPSVHC